MIGMLFWKKQTWSISNKCGNWFSPVTPTFIFCGEMAMFTLTPSDATTLHKHKAYTLYVTDFKVWIDIQQKTDKAYVLL